MTLNKLKDELQIVSHRGLPSDFPENTMVGYREVMGLNVAMLEIDVHLTKDQHFVVIHMKQLIEHRMVRGVFLITHYRN